MSHKLIDHNQDLRRLRDEGYNIDIVGVNLVARDIPYIDGQRNVRYDGILISTLDLNGEMTNRPETHQIRFAGECPCTHEGRPVEALSLQSDVFRLTETLSAQYHFSSKPLRGYYEDYHEKIKTYAALLCSHATNINAAATPRTFRVVEPETDDSPFHYLDTASGRAEINMISAKLAVEKVAIVGVGGTGSYVLDLLAKTPVREIHLFDDDKFSSHNAFRAPGAASKEELHTQPYKVDYFSAIYARMHRGIVPHPEPVDIRNIELLRDMSCVFLCIDAGTGKKFIVEKLEEFEIPFIDTGIGLWAKNETLGGKVRVTTSVSKHRVDARARMSFAGDDGNNEYDNNIQVADLNALNATLAVIRWKKLRQFYYDSKKEHNSFYTIGSNLILSDDIYEAD